ncbi:MAG: hypothetical protein Q9219_007278 [cf. Caloplaca sp. 3 TL-2023]
MIVFSRNVSFLAKTDNTKALGLSDSKPDRTYGSRIPARPTPGKGIALVSDEDKTMVQVCPGIQIPFSAIEHQGPERFAELYVNLYEIRVREGEIWRMTLLDSYVLDKDAGLKKFRKAAGSILQWACIKRKQEVDIVMKTIYADFQMDRNGNKA